MVTLASKFIVCISTRLQAVKGYLLIKTAQDYKQSTRSKLMDFFLVSITQNPEFEYLKLGKEKEKRQKEG